MQNHAIPCKTMPYHAIPCNIMQYHAIPCNTMQYHAIPCIPCNSLQNHTSLITADGAYHCPVGSIMPFFDYWCYIFLRWCCFFYQLPSVLVFYTYMEIDSIVPAQDREWPFHRVLQGGMSLWTPFFPVHGVFLGCLQSRNTKNRKPFLSHPGSSPMESKPQLWQFWL